MVSPSHIVFMFFVCKLVQFTLQKISHPQKNVEDPSMNDSAATTSSQSCIYDVFLSFRGEDTRKTFVDHFYSALRDRQIQTYKDDETLPQGECVGPSLVKAITRSRIAIIIFSKNYADSSWCLEELAYIMKCRKERGLIVMPIFYGVEPFEVRKQEGDFGKAFSKQEAKNTKKVESWRKALVDASKIGGWEPKNIANGHESKVIKEIVDTILDRLLSLNSDFDEDLVGMTIRLEDLKSRLEIGSNGVRMVGVWGVGGGGKTTLASSLYMKISCEFESYHFVENIREESSTQGLKKLQENILSALFKTEMKVNSIAEGKNKIKSMLCRRNVLLVLDDVNNIDQLEALAGSHEWFGAGSRIIITSRDEHLLKTHKVDNICRVKLLSNDESIQLFSKHAYNEKDTIEHYEALSLRVVSYAAGLPLALKVLGSFLYDKDKKGWMSALDRLKDIPEKKIVEKLKISYDGLKTVEKELFLDIACFFRGKRKEDAMEILEACDFHPEIGLHVLRQKALITIVDDRFDMHDLVQEMGQYIVRGKHPKNPEKHSRVWQHEEISNMFSGDTKMDKIKAISYNGYSHGHNLSSRFYMIVSNMKKLRWLKVAMRDGKYDGGPNFLSNELRYIHWEGYPESPFPDCFQPMKLVVLKLSRSIQKELWKGFKRLPRLKVLQLYDMKSLLSTPDFDGLPCLQKLTLYGCCELEEIHPSHVNHTSLQYVSIRKCPKLRMFPTIFHMKNLKTLEIKACDLKDGEIPCDIGELYNLQELNLSYNNFSQLDFSLVQLTRLKLINLSYCIKLLKLPKLPSNLAILKADGCNSLTMLGDCHRNCKWLSQVTFTGGSILNDGNTLLQSMLEGDTIENCSMLLLLEGLEVAKEFTPPLLRGSKCRLQLRENSCSDFCGFLICAILPKKYSWTWIFNMMHESLRISMNQAMTGMDSQDGVVWEESDSDGDKYTWVGYVSFGSLRHTTWWDQTYQALSFNIEGKFDKFCSGFGVRLIAKKNGNDRTETSMDSSNYTPNFEIEHDSRCFLTISFPTFI